MPTPEELDGCIKQIDAGFKYLLGDPLVPNDSGLIVKMEKHLETLNGTVARLKENQQVIQNNQEHVLSRVWASLSPWMQKSIIVWLALSTLLVPTLVSIAVRLWS